MKDYEMVYISSEGSPWGGVCCLTEKKKKVNLSSAVLKRLGKPKRVAIHVGVRANEGKIVISASGDEPGAILVNYDRKKICFYTPEIVGTLQNMIRTYAHGEFIPGIYYTVSGVAVGENAFEFDLRDAVPRVVKNAGKATGKKAEQKKKAPTYKGSLIGSGTAKTAAFSASSGFNMPKMAGRMS